MGKDYVEKYIVYSIDDVNASIMGEYAPPIPDAVVIRLQDTFAPGALWAYANSVATMLDVINNYGIQFDKSSKDELVQVHEYFVAMAIRADEVNHKLPTP